MVPSGRHRRRSLLGAGAVLAAGTAGLYCCGHAAAPTVVPAAKPPPGVVNGIKGAIGGRDALRSRVASYARYQLKIAPLWLRALGSGLLSALSLPIGSVLGVTLESVSEDTIAKWMAFGSGALVFTVATQLYGEALFRLLLVAGRLEGRTSLQPHVGDLEARRRCFEHVCIQVVAGIIGACVYLALNGWLRRYTEEPIRRRQSESDIYAPERKISTASVGRFQSTKEDFDREKRDRGRSAAYAMWLGLLLDGIPESLMLGLMTNEGQVSTVLLVAIFVANFPEAFSGASMLRKEQMPVHQILIMWFAIFLLTGVFSMCGSMLMPSDLEQGSPAAGLRDASIAASQGLTGGSMLAMVATAMLPLAFKGAGEPAGCFFVLGFVLSVLLMGIDALWA